jgi:hypothetical protein
VPKPLAKAEADGVTPPEAQALTAKAAELMAGTGIDRALLAAARPETDASGSRMVDLDNGSRRACCAGWARRCGVRASCSPPATGVHMFGYESDIERTDVLYTSVLVQMSHALVVAVVPDRGSPRAAPAASGRASTAPVLDPETASVAWLSVCSMQAPRYQSQQDLETRRSTCIYVSGAVWQHGREGFRLGTLAAQGRKWLRVMIYVPDDLTGESATVEYFRDTLDSVAAAVEQRLSTRRPDWPVQELATQVRSLCPEARGI